MLDDSETFLFEDL